MITLMAIVLVGMGTYACRAVFVLTFANRKIPDSLLSTLQYVAPATLSALIVTLLIDKDGALVMGIPEGASLIVGASVAYFTRNHIYTLLVGMGVYLTLVNIL